jgi:single-stranded DNA-binding protein
MTSDVLTIAGTATSAPVMSTVWSDLPMVQFTVRTSVQHFNLRTGAYTTGVSNAYLVTAFNHLATNLLECVKVGDRVIVIGILAMNENGQMELTAQSAGLDLRFPPLPNRYI